MRRETILVVDDEPGVLDYCRSALTNAGYAVMTAETSHEAVDSARAEAFALVLVDINMSGMDGLDAFRAIREFEPDVAGLVITGYGSLDNAMRAAQCGFAGLLPKPFTVDELASAVEQALQNRRAARENARLKALVNLHALVEAVGAQGSMRSLLTNALHAAMRETDAEAGSLALADAASDTFARALCVPQGTQMCAAREVAENLMYRQAAETQSPRVYRLDDADGGGVCDLLEAAGLAVSICVPLRDATQLLGAMALHRYQHHGAPAFSEADVRAAAVIAAHSAMAISNAHLRQQLRAPSGGGGTARPPA